MVQLHLGHVQYTHAMLASLYKETRLASVRKTSNGLDLHLNVSVCVSQSKKKKKKKKLKKIIDK